MNPFLRLVIFVLSFSAFAQHSEQPLKESSTDLRNQHVLFKVEDVGEKKTFWLERTDSMEYFLKSSKGKEDLIKKIDSREAKKMDLDFATRFLKCQYEIPSAPGDCKVTLRLTMKGETQDICSKDDKKTQEVNTFVQAISKRF